MPDHDPAPLAPRTDPLAGKLIEGRWRLLSKLGEGGMGAVYLAEQLSIRGRKVAVKVLRAEFAQNEEFVRRFRGEAERAAAVSDPRIVMVLDFGQAESGELFLVMEHVVGDTLTTVLRAGPLPLPRAIVFGTQLADALHRVHEVGVVHRDVKPDNVMIHRGSDDLKLMDFGIARAVDDLEHTQLTASGVVVGTPAFMAPEQITGGAISRQTDIYAWGVVMYTMLAGRRPFTASSATAIQYMHVHEPPPPLVEVRPDVPPAVARIVMCALEKKPEARQRTMAEVAAALRAVRLHEPEGRAAGFEQTPTALLPAVPVAALAPPVRVAHAPAVEGTVIPDAPPQEQRSRRALIAGGALAIAVLAAGAVFVGGRGGLPWALAPDAAPPASHPAAPPDGPAPALASHARADASAARGGTGATKAPAVHDAGSAAVPDAPSAVAEALTVAQFFLDRGEYDSAIEELESALRAAPGEQSLTGALESARKAKAAEEAVLGAVH